MGLYKKKTVLDVHFLGYILLRPKIKKKKDKIIGFLKVFGSSNKKIDVQTQKSGIFGSGSKIILYRPKIHASEKRGS